MADFIEAIHHGLVLTGLIPVRAITEAYVCVGRARHLEQLANVTTSLGAALGMTAVVEYKALWHALLTVHRPRKAPRRVRRCGS